MKIRSLKHAWGSRLWLAAGLLVPILFPPMLAAQDSEGSGVRATVNPAKYSFGIGQPVMVQFLLENRGEVPATFGSPLDGPASEEATAGLPLSHVFSGARRTGVSVVTASGQAWDKPVGYRAERSGEIVLPSGAIAGRWVNLLDFFPVLRSPGEYSIVWKPYDGVVAEASASIEIAARKRVEITTDEGKLTLKLLYEEAPKAVANFLELANTGFYDNLTFHRLVPGHLLMGGDPRGDGTGIRPDGKRVPPEFNDIPHEKGSVAMALLEDDPESASSQFFIGYSRHRDWDDLYTVFARLTGDDSFRTLDRLMATPVDDQGRPKKPLVMRSVRVYNVPAESSISGR